MGRNYFFCSRIGRSIASGVFTLPRQYTKGKKKHEGMHLTHTDNQQRVDLWRGGRVTDIEIFLAAKPYLNRRLAIHYGDGQSVRVFDEPELSIVSRMLAAYYNFESDRVEDPLSDPFYKSSLWNTCVFAQEPDGSIMPVDGSRKKNRQEEDDPGESHGCIYSECDEHIPK